MKKLRTQKIGDLTKGEKNEALKMANKMTAMVKFIPENVGNPEWIYTRPAGEGAGLAGGLTFIHTLSSINLTRQLKILTIILMLLTFGHIVLFILLAPKLSLF